MRRRFNPGWREPGDQLYADDPSMRARMETGAYYRTDLVSVRDEGTHWDECECLEVLDTGGDVWGQEYVPAGAWRWSRDGEMPWQWEGLQPVDTLLPEPAVNR